MTLPPIFTYGLITFDHKNKKYELSRPIKELVEEKFRELLENPLEEGNQQPSSAELAEKVQRLSREGVLPSGGKRETP